MSGIFASQFNYANAYNPVGLDTSTPQVGLNAGRTPKAPEEDPAGEKARPRRPSENTSNASAGAAVGQNAAIGQQTSNLSNIEHAIMQGQNTGSTAALSQGQMNAMTQAAQGIGHVIAQQPASTPWYDSLGHWTAHTFDSMRHGAATGLSHANNFIERNPVMHDLGLGPGLPANATGNSGGLLGFLNPAHASTPDVAPGSQDIKVNSIKLNQGSPQYDVETPQYAQSQMALPRGWSANAVESAPQRLAIEAPGYQPNPLADMVDAPYQAMPRGWAANARTPDFSSMVDSPSAGGANWSANMNPVQFNSVSQDAADGLPRGLSANGGWESDIGSILGDIGDALG